MSPSDTLLILQRQAIDYRNKAEELRLTGENARSAEARRILLGLAADADRMAENVEIKLRSLTARALQ